MQTQKINNYIYLFFIANYEIKKATKFIFNVTKIKNGRNLRHLQENEEISFSIIDYYDGNGGLATLKSDNQIPENQVIVNNLKNDEIELKIINDDVLDTLKVDEGIRQGKMVNFSEVYENKTEYKFYQYKIKNSTTGCNFYLYSDKIIEQEYKNISLNFLKVNTDEVIKKNITVYCALSNKNKNKIVCLLNTNINISNYILDYYINSDEKETITIVQNDINNDLSLSCDLKENSLHLSYNKKRSGLTVGAIIGIILAFIFVVAIAIFAIIYYKKRDFNSLPQNHSSAIANFFEYPSTTTNINEV